MDREMFIKNQILKKFPNLKSFAESIGMPYTTLLSILQNVGGASWNNVMKICNGANIDTELLDNENIEQEVIISSKIKTTPIRLMNNVCSAGNGAILEGDSYEVVELPNVPRGADFAVQVRGDSMEPLYRDGEVIFIHEQPAVEVGEIGLFIYDNEGYLKQLGKGELLSLNPKYTPIELKHDMQFKCCGKVLN